MPPRARHLAVVLSLVLVSACQKQEIKSYRVAKEKPSAENAQESHAGHAHASGEMPKDHPPMDGLPSGHPPVAKAGPAGGAGMPVTQSEAAAGDLTWTAPASWQTKPLGQMRKGSYGIKGEGTQEADLSVFVFPGAAGGTIDNINRWRGQVGLPPLSQAQLPDETTALVADSGLELTVVDMTGKGDERIVGAILAQGQQSWFFKLKGPASLLEKEKPAFLAFLKTVKTR